MRKTRSVLWLSALAAIAVGTIFFMHGGRKADMSSRTNAGVLTAEERAKIAEFAQKVDVDSAVGQLFMVGLPADINTIRDKGSADVDRMMGRQVGFVLPQAYTYYDDGKLQVDEYLSKVIEFNNAVQLKATKGPLGIPVLFAADFEGPYITPFRRGLLPPPSSLSLGATQDKKSLTSAGALVGVQLKHAGIHILLGPVLDVYNIKQGNRNGLLDRSFAADPEGVARLASNFLTGVRLSGLSMIAKHYPSHGSIETNPHSRKQIPRYEGSNEQRFGELKPFEQNHSLIDGVMTSHIEIEASSGWKMATFSNELLVEIKRREVLSEKILITDDLSEMGAVGKYMDTTNASFADMTIQAFKAGHDILLFAHVAGLREAEQARKAGKNKFSVENLESVIAQLVAHIKSNKSYEDKFRISLEKILRLKVETAKRLQYRDPVKLLEKNNKKSFFHVAHNGTQAIEHIDHDLKEMLGHIGLTPTSPVSGDGIRERILFSAIEKSAVAIRDAGLVDAKLIERGNDFKVLFAADAAAIAKFKSIFSPHFPKARYVTVPFEKSGDEFKKAENQISSLYPSSDLLIYVVYDESDADVLSRLHVRGKREFAKKALIFLHASPAILDPPVLTGSTIIGLFTRHPSAIDVNIEILMGRKQPRELKNLPVNVGDNGKYYNVTNTEWVLPADPESYEKVFSRRELESSLQVVRDHYIVIPKGWNTLLKVVFALLVLVLIAEGLRRYVTGVRENGRTPPAWLFVFESRLLSWSAGALVALVLSAFWLIPTEARKSLEELAPLTSLIKGAGSGR